MTARAVALGALERIEHGAYANLVLPSSLRASDLDTRDRALATELVYGTVRRRRALDWLIAPCSSQPLAKLEPVVRCALRLGAYQLTEGVAPHAAVSETVAAVARVAPRARGYVNGVLRAVARAGPPWRWPEGDDVEALGVRYSHPDWIVALLVEQFGVEVARAQLEVADTRPPVTLRVNPQRATPEAVEAELVAAGGRVTRGGLVPDALVVSGLGDPGALASVRDGRATPQDQASQVVAQLVSERLPANARVLDVAAAPGGKATAIAERAPEGSLVVAADLNASRARLVAEGSERLGLGARLAVIVADGRRPPVPSATFDTVLLDAPCSGLGVLRRRPDARWRVGPDDVSTLAVLQQELLVAAAEVLRPGGILAYAVCTLSAAETLAVDAFAAQHLPTLRPLTPPGSPWHPHGRGALLLPSAAGTDGMFVLLLASDGAGGPIRGGALASPS